ITTATTFTWFATASTTARAMETPRDQRVSLSSRMKLLMIAEAFTGFVLLALVISRAVNILS
ncbi:hypothetical protein C5C27_03990, partial [Rathayibacter sp. AY2B7]